MSRFRMLPTSTQEEALLGHCAHARYVWNLAVEQHSHWRHWRQPAPNYYEQARQLTAVRGESEWLGSGSQMVQQQALRDFDQAMGNFFNGTQKRPTWRKRGVHEGFRIVAIKSDKVRRLNRAIGEVFVPKVGWVKFRWSRQVPAAVSYRITRDTAGRWHVAFASVPQPIAAPGNGKTVGVDRGVKVPAALSTGELLSVRGLQAGERQRLLRLQRGLSRCQKGSNRREKVKTQIARMKAREADRRKDWVEKTSTRLATEFDLIRVEDLKIRNMTRTARGTSAAPGHNVRQKTGLNRGILASGWGRLVTRLEQKAPGRVEKIPAAYTSQTCSVCKTVDAEARKSQAVFACRSCGYTGHADVNAALNIAAGRAVTARGDLATTRQSVKREPQQLAHLPLVS